MEASFEVEAVIEFLRENGLKEAVKALEQDVMEKNEEEEKVCAFDFEKLLFPMPPPVRITAIIRRSEEDERVKSSDVSGSDGDEFVSLRSSSSDVCSSDFVNPYGLHSASQADSDTSSDRLSQFRTAREYPDFEMQNDLFWHEDKDEDHFLTPCFAGSDFYSIPSRDKFVTTSVTEMQRDNRLISYDKSDGSRTEDGIDYLDKPCLFNMTSTNGEDQARIMDYYHFDKCNGLEGDISTVMKLKMENSVNLRLLQMKRVMLLMNFKCTLMRMNTKYSINVTEYLGSAAFSKVVRAHDLLMGIDVCLKIVKNDKYFVDQSLDEIKLLKLVNKHDPGDKHHILRLFDYFYHREHLFIVCELLRANLYEFQKFNQESGGEAYFTLGRLQIIARQCLEALDYLHELGIIHRDLKPENILIKSYTKCEIKIIDLGSSCFRTDNSCLYVQSRSYRAPEVILGLPYDQKVDLWSLGCILAEICSGEVLFPNDAVVMILTRMVGMLGPFDTEMLENGQETYKYFTKEYDLYHINEETDQLEYIFSKESSLEQHLQVCDAPEERRFL
ncbi:cyclin-dependent kinase 18-like [Hibiscus syriacus]|nr:cyclin-dependent kinase 18-like [Hibiscus syriacus]